MFLRKCWKNFEDVPECYFLFRYPITIKEANN